MNSPIVIINSSSGMTTNVAAWGLAQLVGPPPFPQGWSSGLPQILHFPFSLHIYIYIRPQTYIFKGCTSFQCQCNTPHKIQSTDSQKGLISGKKKDKGEGKRLLIKATKRIFGFAT
ncbi:Uncharacterized protein TCM_036894 [Theobroma cacao]|uniref:Uncharacterized protein n=1 Tax=Theobroma cacao TaxID=3641 RepID=A0A061GJH7_THECC|nr:Uncharacterized protein TCM_036894 [Theobroma cacao]